MLRPHENVEPAQWVVSGLHGFLTKVTSVVPEGFAAYLRVPHEDGGSDLLGDLPAALAERLVAALTKTGNAANGDWPCFFAVWDGYGGLNVTGALFAIPGRRLALYSGQASDAITGFQYSTRARYAGRSTDALALTSTADDRTAPEFVWRQSPNLWWPLNRVWCVATDIDLPTTYIGCDQITADTILIRVPNASIVRPQDEL